MRITADTNVLVRAMVGDDPVQERAAKKFLREAGLIAVPLSSLCEFVWVLRSGYGYGREQLLIALDALLQIENVVVNLGAVNAGIAMLRSGADFADGVIAFEGSLLGGDTFASFDVKAVSAMTKQGKAAWLLS